MGEPAVYELFERTSFDLAITGHIHESQGVESIAETQVVNPGAVVDGNYAIAELTTHSVDSIQFKEQ